MFFYMLSLGYLSDNRSFDLDINVTLSNNTWYQVALYSVDWNNEGISMMVRVFDLSTFNLITQTVYIHDISNYPKWIIYNVDRSIRIRIDQITGNTSSISALLFDPI